MKGIIDDLWRYRIFILLSVRNELLSRLTRSKLGGAWVVLSPLSQVLIFSLILSNVLRAKIPGIESQYAYAIYLMSGMLAWSLFNQISLTCLTLFINKAGFLKKIAFPRVTLPMIVLGTSLVNYAVLFIAMLAIFLSLGHVFTPATLWLIPLTVILAFFAISIGILIGILAVFIRDLIEAVPILLNLLFWSTPIVYPTVIIPETYRHLLAVNPLYHFVTAFQDILVYGRAPELRGIAIISLCTVLILTLSLATFRKAGEEIVDAL